MESPSSVVSTLIRRQALGLFLVLALGLPSANAAGPPTGRLGGVANKHFHAATIKAGSSSDKKEEEEDYPAAASILTTTTQARSRSLVERSMVEEHHLEETAKKCSGYGEDATAAAGASS